MPDITMCNSESCPLKTNCMRHKNNTEPNALVQTYFAQTPYNEDTNQCEFLINEQEQKDKLNRGEQQLF